MRRPFRMTYFFADHQKQNLRDTRPARKELDNIYAASAALSVKVLQARKQSQPIGYKLPEKNSK